MDIRTADSLNFLECMQDTDTGVEELIGCLKAATPDQRSNFFHQLDLRNLRNNPDRFDWTCNLLTLKAGLHAFHSHLSFMLREDEDDSAKDGMAKGDLAKLLVSLMDFTVGNRVVWAALAKWWLMEETGLPERRLERAIELARRLGRIETKRGIWNQKTKKRSPTKYRVVNPTRWRKSWPESL